MSRRLSAKKFLVKKFAQIFLATTLFVFVAGAVISEFHLRGVQHLYAARIRDIVEIQRNELLNEIALHDQDALKMHLSSLLKELSVDSITLEVNGESALSVPEDGEKSHAGAVVEGPLRLRPLVIPISNEFRSVTARLTISFARSFEQWVLLPFLKTVLGIFLISIFPVGLVFFLLFRNVDRMLLLPLRQATARLSGEPMSEVNVADAHRALAEISSLELARMRFQKIERQIAFVAMAAQVSHDIRSPLAALKLATYNLHDLPEEVRLLIRSATQRINDIANQLLQAGKPGGGVTAPLSGSAEALMLAPILDSVLSEMRIQLGAKPKIELRDDFDRGRELFSVIDASELARVLSNLLNNSIEAISGAGEVVVRLYPEDPFSVVHVEDNGKGIPPEILPRLTQKGISHGKEGSQSGSGLGLYHARETLERAGGQFQINSQEGRGTNVFLKIPEAPAPDWFAGELNLAAVQILVSLDDDDSIHQIWANRLDGLKGGGEHIQHLAFSSMEQLGAWLQSGPKHGLFYLIDYELIGQQINGLELIEKLQISGQSILVTSRYSEPLLRAHAKRLGVRILPKSLAPFVHIKV